MSSRFTSPFDDLLAENRRALDALYRDPAQTGPDRSSDTSAPQAPSAPPAAPPAEGPSRAAPSVEPASAGGGPGPLPRPSAFPAPAPAPAPASSPPPDRASIERLLDERYGDGWRFEVTSRRREGDEVIVVGALRLPGPGVVRTQFGSARITADGERRASGSAGGVEFSFGGEAAPRNPFAAEEAAYARAGEDALAGCAALLRSV